MARIPPPGEHEPLVEGFIADLFRLLLEREPDQESFDFYVEFVRWGAPLSAVVDGIVQGIEFHARQRDRWLHDRLDEKREGAPRAERAGMRVFNNQDAAYWEGNSLFPADYQPACESGRAYATRRASGFLAKYCSGPLVLDVGFQGGDNPENKPALPHAIGIDLGYPGYDGRRLPFADGIVDTVYSSHCLEHIPDEANAIQDWFRVLRVGGFIVCMVPHQALYEKRRALPSIFNHDHKRLYTPASLIAAFEAALPVNHYRLRHLADNDMGFDYRRGPALHSDGCYEIELVIEKIVAPEWELA